MTPPSWRGWLAMRPTGRPSMRAKRGDHVAGPARRDLEDAAAVDTARRRRGRRRPCAASRAPAPRVAPSGSDDRRCGSGPPSRAGAGPSRSRTIAAASSSATRWATPFAPCTRGRRAPPSSRSSPIAAATTPGPVRNMRELLGHHHEVGQRRRVGAAAGGDAGDDRDLRHLARELDAGAEDPAVAGERGVALLQAGAAGARRSRPPARPASPASSHRADDRVGVDLAEAAAEEGRVLGVAEDRAAVDLTGAGERPRRRVARRAQADAATTPLRIGWKLPGSQSICSRPSGVSAASGGGALTAVAWSTAIAHLAARGRGRRCGRRSRTSWRSRRGAVSVHNQALAEPST